MRTSDINKAFVGINDSRDGRILRRVAESVSKKPGKKQYKHPQARKIARVKRILEANGDT